MYYQVEYFTKYYTIFCPLLESRKSLLEFSTRHPLITLVNISLCKLLSNQPYKYKISWWVFIKRSDRYLGIKMLLQLLVIFKVSNSAAGVESHDAIAQQPNPKCPDRETVDLKRENYQKQTSTINNILQVQIGHFYNQYKSNSNKGVLHTSQNRADFRQKIVALFDEVKTETKTRLRNSYNLAIKNNGMKKGFKNRHKLYARRHKLYESYLRS